MGRFELAVMAAVIRLGDKAYGRELHSHLEERLRRRIAMGQVYVVLNRLQHEGLLKAHFGEPTAVRGGRAKKFYEVTGHGRRAFTNTRSVLFTVLDGAEV